MIDVHVVIIIFGLLLASAIVLPLLPTDLAHNVNIICAVLIGGIALIAALLAYIHGSTQSRGVGLDDVGLLFWSVNALIGTASALVSPWYLKHAPSALFRDGVQWYYLGFYLFWATLLAIPAASNLGVAWLLIEASTGTSALLVAYKGTKRSLEAGWKYLILTSLGLTVALAGIVILYGLLAHHEQGLESLNWTTIAQLSHSLPHTALLIANLLIFAGFAAKVGWAPVHHWLPDAHSEAPAPVSALLSAALLPSVILIIWRLQHALGGPVYAMEQRVFIGFGIISIAVAIPFLWRPLPIKRLFAYSSLEHMGIIAIGLGFGTPLAIAGVLLHFVGHALAKSLGFYATIPLLAEHPEAIRRASTGLARQNGPLGFGVGISLWSLNGIPPSPLFVSELFILIGGMQIHQIVVVIIVSFLLALAFIGLLSQTIEGLFGHVSVRNPFARIELLSLSVLFGVLILATSVTAIVLQIHHVTTAWFWGQA